MVHADIPTIHYEQVPSAIKVPQNPHMQPKKCLQKFVAPFWSWSPPSMGHCWPSPDLTDVKCYISWVSRTVWEQGLLQSWTKVLGHFCISGAFFNSHRSNPSPHPTNNVRHVYQEFFSSFNFVQGGRRENCKKFSKRMHCFNRKPGNDRKTWILQYCPKDFCPGLSECWFWEEKSLFPSFFLLFLGVLKTLKVGDHME